MSLYLVSLVMLLLSVQLVGLLVSNWLYMWFMMEISLYLFMAVESAGSLEHKSVIKEGKMMYFCVQTIASILMMSGGYCLLSYDPMSHGLFYAMVILALMLKLGYFPFHVWVPKIFPRLSFLLICITVTAMKLLPLSLLSATITQGSSLEAVIQFSAVATALAGASLGLVSSSLRGVIAGSSLVHSGWILIAVTQGNWVYMFFAYSLSMILFTYSELKNLSYLWVASILNLSGLPPFTMFYPKLLVIKGLVVSNYPIAALGLILAITLSILFYSRLCMMKLLAYYSRSYSQIPKI